MIEKFFTLFSSAKLFLIHTLFFFFGEIDFSVFTHTQIFLDIFITGIIIFFILKLLFKIHALHIIFILSFFFVLLYISSIFSLIASKYFIQGILLLLCIALPLIFQQEARQFFERIRTMKGFFLSKQKQTEKHRIVKNITQATHILAEKKHGALIVLERTYPLDVYASTGISLHAYVSKELLLNIFFPKSPLHDGAVIIKKGTIICAGAVLPFSYTSSEYMGTRHKAALGLSEMTDALIIAVSEERGEVSLVYNKKMIRKIKPHYLEHFLLENL
jgi:diadenylate cyclase